MSNQHHRSNKFFRSEPSGECELQVREAGFFISREVLREIILVSFSLLLGSCVYLTIRKEQISIKMKLCKFLSALLGGFILMAGNAKFFSPFDAMFFEQIKLAGLPYPLFSQYFGQISEIASGLLLLLFAFIGYRFNNKINEIFFSFGNFLLLGAMIVGIYVHLSPDVPATVLPFQSKPPVLPIIVIILTCINMFLFAPKESGKFQK